jgi:hypothetical protein
LYGLSFNPNSNLIHATTSSHECPVMRIETKGTYSCVRGLYNIAGRGVTHNSLNGETLVVNQVLQIMTVALLHDLKRCVHRQDHQQLYGSNNKISRIQTCKLS